MPFGSNNTFTIDDREGNNSANKIIIIFNDSVSSRPYDKQQASLVSLKSDSGYEGFLNKLPSGVYQKAAGTDLSTIFFPYLAREKYSTSDSSKMPSFASGLGSSGNYNKFPGTLYSLMPYEFENSSENLTYQRALQASGDSIRGNLSGRNYLGDSNRFIKRDDIRSVGVRLPMVGIGWGLDIYGNPYPSGTITGNGHNAVYNYRSSVGSGYENVREGYKVNPKDYVAAPIDLRYDPRNHVWTAPKGFWAEVTSEGSGIYSWRQVIYENNGAIAYTSMSGGSSLSPAIEANHLSDASGIVYLYPKEYKHYHMFVKGGGAGGESVSARGQYQYQVYQMVSNNAEGWDYVRAHP